MENIVSMTAKRCERRIVVSGGDRYRLAPTVSGLHGTTVPFAGIGGGFGGSRVHALIPSDRPSPFGRPPV